MIKPAFDSITITPVDLSQMEEPAKDPSAMAMSGEERKTLDLRFRVVAVGRGKYNPHCDRWIEPIVKPGDIIILADSDQSIRDFWKHHSPVMDNGVPLMFTDEEAIHAFVTTE